MRNMFRLRDQIVFLEVADARHIRMNAQQYLAAARQARTLIKRELGGLSMQSFAFPHLPAIQTTAENIYFESYGCFADLDGSGKAAAAQSTANALIARAKARARAQA